MKKYILMILILLILILPMLLVRYFVKDYNEIKMDIRITDANTIGVNSDTDGLHFGRIPKGSNAFRKIHVYTEKCNKCKVSLVKTGDFKGWITISKNNFYIYNNKTEEVILNVNVPLDARMGDYNGTLKIYFWKVI